MTTSRTPSQIASDADYFYVLQDWPERNHFDMDEARVFHANDDGTFTDVLLNGDVYQALAIASIHPMLGHVVALGTETCGWAAPLTNGDTDGPPSEHPERRRVRLVTVMTRDLQSGSCITFEDTNKRTLDEGEATGSLALALQHAVTTSLQATQVWGGVLKSLLSERE